MLYTKDRTPRPGVLLWIVTGLLLLGPWQTAHAISFTPVQPGQFGGGYGYYGPAWGDFDEDGDPDLYLSGGTNNLSRLFINQGDGSFSESTDHGIATANDYSNSALWADLNGDGHLDLYVSNWTDTFNFLYLNSGPPDYTFTRVDTAGVTHLNVESWTSTAADYDNDGDADLFVGGDQNDANYYFTNHSTPDQLNFEILPDGDYLDAGDYTAHVSLVDLDDDNDKDLFMVNYAGGNDQLYRNMLAETGTATFERITDGPLVNDGFNTLAASWGDYDNDADFDLFISTYTGPSGAVNQIWRNDGDMTLTQVDVPTINVDGYSTLGSVWGDFDNDGDVDLVIGNGENDGLHLYVNYGNNLFLREPIYSTGYASCIGMVDFDDDGWLDMFVSSIAGGSNVLLRNDGGTANHWLLARLEGISSDPHGIGAVVYASAEIGGERQRQIRQVHAMPAGDRSTTDKRVHVGLGDAAQVDTLTVHWPSGAVDEWYDVTVDQVLTLVEGDGDNVSVEDRFGEAGTPRRFELAPVYPNPFNGQATVTVTLPRASRLQVELVNLAGQRLLRVDRGVQPAGTHSLTLSARSLASGSYLLRASVPGQAPLIQRVVLVK